MLGMPNRFSYEELKNVTNNFSNKLGQGGFGSVFRGILPSGSEVAVKHLVGFGPVKSPSQLKLLVYKYMANGSLDQWIFNKNQEPALGWQIRKKIILDIAKGLAYLHEECNQKILHLDIKSQNILLDENFNAKVSDFGLSKLIGRDQSRVVTTMRGTPGYMAPECSQQVEDRHLVGLFRRKQEMGQLMDLVDKCSDDMLSNAAEVVEMMKVTAWCLQTEYARRPSMSIVVKLFEGSVDVVSNMNEEDLLNGLTHEAMETFASTVLPSMLSGPR
ncbi:G-type lectin S-receptor-like serine/threonine-protein kinase SD2-5 [Gossypium arboreum]|uniref:G-type lectin S-receptor-like serine/threonine-protein kinase SD2-5 n=1 Tax=Gossypium arboreum TaxID=29729 RepID=UPI0022F1A66F|nr:G-type lectin S-receptor-like serine/threonine-protein kinase SD2-5 [Gossypium arboreum]